MIIFSFTTTFGFTTKQLPFEFFLALPMKLNPFLLGARFFFELCTVDDVSTALYCSVY